MGTVHLTRGRAHAHVSLDSRRAASARPDPRGAGSLLMHVFDDLVRRQHDIGRPVTVAVCGTGYFGAGLVRRIARVRGMTPAIAANRTLDKALAALVDAGVARADIRVCGDARSAQHALESGLHVATTSLTLPADVPGVDVLMEATGDIMVGA